MNEFDLLRTCRRDLHRIPELDVDLPKTLAYVEARLAELKDACMILHPCKSTICALFEASHSDNHRTVAVRTDMDALPVTERTGAPYASQHEGRMHACGHDGHMAMALALCRWLAAHRNELSRNVMVAFQPAEETSGGARRLCKSGVFEQYGVDRIFGFHLWPDLPEGVIASRPGPLLASSNEVDVTFSGRSSHIATWQEGRDALRAATHFVGDVYERLERMASESVPSEGHVLLRFGTMGAGTVRNAIAATAEVHGSLRAERMADRADAMQVVKRAAAAAASAQGCTTKVHFSEGNPPVTNDRHLFELAANTLPHLTRVKRPLLIAEDFAWYQQCLPGLFLLLGTGTGIPLHADTFDFDERVLQVGLDAYKRLVMLP